jgi:hypothetical protein
MRFPGSGMILYGVIGDAVSGGSNSMVHLDNSIACMDNNNG